MHFWGWGEKRFKAQTSNYLDHYNLFNIVNYIFLLLYMFCSGYSLSLCCSVYCVCKWVLYHCYCMSTQLQLTTHPTMQCHTQADMNVLKQCVTTSNLIYMLIVWQYWPLITKLWILGNFINDIHSGEYLLLSITLGNKILSHERFTMFLT
jgi:hypothetical protein